MKKDVSRRAFLGRLGAGAMGGAALSRFNRSAGASGGALPGGGQKTAPWTAPPTLSNPNILIIMVDQMRWPQWLSAAQAQTFAQQIAPNICGKIRNKSYVFDQYYTAATVCTASRGTLLTGLYAPQTAVYAETDGTSPQILLPAFPTWADAVQALNTAYGGNLWWFGKWHLSTCNTTTPLAAYGFQTRTYPGGKAKNPSPDGFPNEGTNGGPHNGHTLASDKDIAGDFIGWLEGKSPTPQPPAAPWCATVSLINPHDIAGAPAFRTTYFPKPGFPPASGAPAMYTQQPSPWNYEDLTQVANKPPLQYAFQSSLNQSLGAVSDWVTFLNDYYWLQNYVDQQVGRVLQTLAGSAYAANTVVIFTADHGEYGGSHGLHDKGDAAYDESIRVPLYVRFPGQTSIIAMNQMCSSVDMFGLICDFATGGGSRWQTTYPDLASRQSIWSFLYQNAGETRLAAALGGIPYIFHTSDETALTPANGPNAHIVCLRTKDTTAQPGAKLGVYSQWAPCTVVPDAEAGQDFEFYDYNPVTSHNTGELGNDYYSTNPITQAAIGNYQAALGSWGPGGSGLIANELDKPLTGVGTDGKPLAQAQLAAQQNFFKFLGQKCTG